MKCLFLIPVIVSLTGCATLVKPDRQNVNIVGGSKDGMTKLDMPDGQHEFKGGQGSILVTRSKEDIPVQVTCDGVTRNGVMPTHFDFLFGGLGNFVFGGIIGWIIDPLSPKAYDAAPSFNVSSLCGQNPVAAVEVPKTKVVQSSAFKPGHD